MTKFVKTKTLEIIKSHYFDDISTSNLKNNILR